MPKDNRMRLNPLAPFTTGGRRLSSFFNLSNPMPAQSAFTPLAVPDEFTPTFHEVEAPTMDFVYRDPTRERFLQQQFVSADKQSLENALMQAIATAGSTGGIEGQQMLEGAMEAYGKGISELSQAGAMTALEQAGQERSQEIQQREALFDAQMKEALFESQTLNEMEIAQAEARHQERIETIKINTEMKMENARQEFEAAQQAKEQSWRADLETRIKNMEIASTKELQELSRQHEIDMQNDQQTHEASQLQIKLDADKEAQQADINAEKEIKGITTSGEAPKYAGIYTPSTPIFIGYDAYGNPLYGNEAAYAENVG